MTPAQTVAIDCTLPGILGIQMEDGQWTVEAQEILIRDIPGEVVTPDEWVTELNRATQGDWKCREFDAGEEPDDPDNSTVSFVFTPREAGEAAWQAWG